MKVVDLIIELAKVPQDLEVVFDTTLENAEEFRFEVIDDVGEIMTDRGDKFVLLNLKRNEDI